MRNFIYGSVIAIMLIFVVSLLAIYYTQPFDEDFDFKSSISFSEIEIERSGQYQTYDYNTGQYVMADGTNLQSARAEIGTLKLKNDGFFTRVYAIPSIIGCIELKDSVDTSKVTLRQNQFLVNLIGDGYSYGDYQIIEIKPGEIKEYTLKAEYNAYNTPISEFTSGNMRGVSVYVIRDKESNPLNTEYDSYGYSNGCNSLKDKATPEAEILIIWFVNC